MSLNMLYTCTQINFYCYPSTVEHEEGDNAHLMNHIGAQLKFVPLRPS